MSLETEMADIVQTDYKKKRSGLGLVFLTIPVAALVVMGYIIFVPGANIGSPSCSAMQEDVVKILSKKVAAISNLGNAVITPTLSGITTTSAGCQANVHFDVSGGGLGEYDSVARPAFEAIFGDRVVEYHSQRADDGTLYVYAQMK
jgi:hypothetical protein